MIGFMGIATGASGQVVLPISALQYDAPSLPPTLWATTHTVTRDMALLPAKTLEEKNSEQYALPYRVSVSAAYRDSAGKFGSLNLGNSTTADISFDGDSYSVSADFSVQREDVVLGAVGSYEDLDLAGFGQKRTGIMPYGKWLVPISERTSFNVVGTAYYFKNDVESHLPPRVFSDYDTVGASISAALHFDTRYAYKAVSVAQNSARARSYVGSVAATLHVQSDDANREVVYQQRVVDEVDDQMLLVLGGNIGVRLQERTALMLAGEYGFDRSDYDGSLSGADDDYARLSLSFTRTLSADWSLQGGIGRAFSHDVNVTDIQISASTRF